jgi:hypothetical protein
MPAKEWRQGCPSETCSLFPKVVWRGCSTRTSRSARCREARKVLLGLAREQELSQPAIATQSDHESTLR